MPFQKTSLTNDLLSYFYSTTGGLLFHCLLNGIQSNKSRDVFCPRQSINFFFFQADRNFVCAETCFNFALQGVEMPLLHGADAVARPFAECYINAILLTNTKGRVKIDADG